MITLTNGTQVPENAVQLQTTAAIDGYYVTQPLRLVQYDETLPVAAVQLTYQNQPYTPPTGAELNVRMGKPDGTTVYNPCLGVDANGVVYFAFTLQMTIVAGTGTLTVEITDSGVKNSAPIIAEIRPNPVPEGAIASTDEFLTLQEILAEAEKWGQIVQTNASNIQQVVDNLEDIQNAAENAQAAAESAAAAQQAAQEALGFRKFYSAVVPDANGNLDPSRPMTVGPAASVGIESAGDRIQSVTAFGFTTQAGTGDPSPTNVRAITNGGLKLVEMVLDGSSDENWNLSSDGSVYFAYAAGFTVSGDTPVFGYASWLEKVSVSPAGSPPPEVGQCTMFAQSIGNLIVKTNTGAKSVSELKQILAANPLTIWYVPADESQATGLYAPIIIQSGEYRATCLPLTAPLCEGDSVVSWVKSGCDKVIVLDGTTNRVVDGGTYWFNYAASDVLPGSAVYSDYVSTGEMKAVSNYIQIRKTAVVQYGATADALNKHLAAHPLTVWYRSTNYTEAADIPVSLETHVQWTANIFDATRTWKLREDLAPNLFVGAISPKPKTAVCVCDTYKGVATSWNYVQDNQIQVLGGEGYVGIRDSRYSTADNFEQALGSAPVTIVYQLATPITYAHEAVVLEAATGEQLTYTVTGQSGGTVSVALKPFQDGGNAKRLDGLTLLAIKESLTPVGYIFSWAPVDDGPDLSTPAKVAEYFGFGTWQAYGTGQVLVGVDSGQTEFATVGQTGGEKAHQLTVNEIPAHNHETNISNTAGENYLPLSTNAAANVSSQIVTTNTGGGQAHNNLQPYVVVYRWQRVA